VLVSNRAVFDFDKAHSNDVKGEVQGKAASHFQATVVRITRGLRDPARLDGVPQIIPP
jgi:hypothetical protein